MVLGPNKQHAMYLNATAFPPYGFVNDPGKNVAFIATRHAMNAHGFPSISQARTLVVVPRPLTKDEKKQKKKRKKQRRKQHKKQQREQKRQRVHKK